MPTLGAKGMRMMTGDGGGGKGANLLFSLPALSSMFTKYRPYGAPVGRALSVHPIGCTSRFMSLGIKGRPHPLQI
jgi:hypothetical protein